MKAINKNISKAETIDKSFYLDEDIFLKCKEDIFAKSWHFISDERSLDLNNNSYAPFDLLPKYLNEPLLISNNNGVLNCLSNVCTHRGLILKDHPGNEKKITCKYHGRRFGLDGTMEFMPEFKEAEDFPRPCDNLKKLPLEQWRQFLFTSLNPSFDFEKISSVLESKVGFLPLEEFRFAPEYTTEYFVKANWALYCDNYLEGFHIPFVHQKLNEMIDYGDYTTEIYDYCNVQIGFSSEGSDYFELPVGHPEYGRKVTAYYFWVFPNMMLNFYNYGLQINIVKPYTVDTCKVSFLFYLYDMDAFKKMDAEVFSAKVEREDEIVVEAVQRGLQSRFYQNGRFSPTREQGVHHFHRLAYKFLEV